MATQAVQHGKSDSLGAGRHSTLWRYTAQRGCSFTRCCQSAIVEWAQRRMPHTRQQCRTGSGPPSKLSRHMGLEARGRPQAQAWRLVSDPQARPRARWAAVGLHVSLVERAQALVRPGVPAPSADDGGGAGAGGGAEGGGRGARRAAGVPAIANAPNDPARVLVSGLHIINAPEGCHTL